MDAACTIQDSIHVFSLVRKYVSRILGTYHYGWNLFCNLSLFLMHFNAVSLSVFLYLQSHYSCRLLLYLLFHCPDSLEFHLQ